ncbi:MAG TPA: hypothetical protein ACFYEH_07925 [Candidatus Brocadiaceae bacterium]
MRVFTLLTKIIYRSTIFLLSFAVVGCANHLRSLNNNSTITIDRGFGVGVGADPHNLTPRAYLNMGTNARIGKHDRIVITVNKNSTIITAENLNYEADYNKEGNLIHEVRGRDIQVVYPVNGEIGTRTTHLSGELPGPIKIDQENKGIFCPDKSGITIGK